MTSIFTRENTVWHIHNEVASDKHSKLPIGNYTLCQTELGFHLEEAEAFKLPSKLYGKNTQHAQRILTTFDSRPSVTGILLEGEKGSGKTLLAKQLAVLATTKQIPTILINSGCCGDPFNKFIQSIEQPCILFFDEFEKTYGPAQQQALLTFLDGVFPSKKLCVFTVNDRYKLDHNMINRPGRIFYMLTYAGLDVEFVREYCEDRLINKSRIDSVTRVSSIFRAFNFDQLQSLVEEMNRYDETAPEAMRLLNIKPEYDSAVRYDVELKVKGQKVVTKQHQPEGWTGNPITCVPSLTIFFISNDQGKGSIPPPPFDHDEEDDDDNDRPTVMATFTVKDFVAMDPKRGTFDFSNDKDQKLRLTRHRQQTEAYQKDDF